MKVEKQHIFVVHSHTTFYMAISIIDYLKLPYDNCVFISDRKYKNRYFENIVFNDLQNIFVKFSPLKLSKIVFLRKSIKITDKKVNSLVNNSQYIAYIPQLSHPFFQILVSNKNCLAYNYIEEGIANYRKELYTYSFFQLSSTKKIIINVFNRFLKRIVFNHSFFGHYKYSTNLQPSPKYFYLKNNCHFFKENVVLLDWIKHDVDIELLNNCAIFISSVLVEYNLIDERTYLLMIEKLIEKIVDSNLSNLYIKFHPFQSTEIKNKIHKICDKHDLNSILIPDNESVEQIVMNIDYLKIYGFESSLLFYSKILNKTTEVYSLNNFIDAFNVKDKSQVVENSSSKELYSNCGIIKL